MADPLEDLLRRSTLNDRQRAGLWDLYEGAKNPDDLTARLQSMDIPQEIKAQLWDLKSQEGASVPPVEPVTPPRQTWSDQLGLNEPTASVPRGFLRGAGAGAVDLLQGAVSNVTGQIRSAQQTNAANEQSARRRFGLTGSLPSRPTVPVPDVASPETMSGSIGSGLVTAAEMALPVGGGVKVAKAALPNAARAGKAFESVMGAAKAVPVDVQDVGNVALRVSELAERGGSMPMAVRKLLNRVTDPKRAPMLYEESRDFASNISRLSANEYSRLTPVVAKEVAALRVALNKANLDAASAVGKGAEYSQAMKEYARAMRLKDAVDAAVSGAKKALPYAVAGGAAGAGGYWLTRQVRSALSGGE